MNQNVTYKYVRDAFSDRILVIIAIVDGNKVGYAYPHPKKDVATKKRGREIALGRAMAGTRPPSEPSRRVDVMIKNTLHMQADLSFVVKEAIEQALKDTKR